MTDRLVTCSISPDGLYRIVFDSPYFYGDIVVFESAGVQGAGVVVDITLTYDGSVSYTVELQDGTAQCGIYPDEMVLVERGPGL